MFPLFFKNIFKHTNTHTLQSSLHTHTFEFSCVMCVSFWATWVEKNRFRTRTFSTVLRRHLCLYLCRCQRLRHKSSLALSPQMVLHRIPLSEKLQGKVAEPLGPQWKGRFFFSEHTQRHGVAEFIYSLCWLYDWIPYCCGSYSGWYYTIIFFLLLFDVIVVFQGVQSSP